MFLTSRARTSPRDHTKFPTTQIALLAFVRVAEPIALTSILPYAWKFVIHFQIGDESHASFYSGLLIATFSLAEACTGMVWGSVSDQVGRKPVLLLGCFGTMISLLIVGLAPNFWVALFGRALGGLLNGNIGVVQTMVGELVTIPKHEPRAYAVMPFIWSIGTIVGPAIGGFFADPCENFPSTFSSSGIFARFPYFLPNLMCACLLFVSIVAGVFLIEETHPDMQPWSLPSDLDTSTAETPLMARGGATDHFPSDLRNESYGTFNTVEVLDQQRFVTADGRPARNPEVTRPKILSRRIVMLIIALGIFTYHTMTYDTLISVFLEDSRVDNDFTALSSGNILKGGLGLSIQDVGVVLAVNGVLALFVQAVIFPLAASYLGVWKLFVITTLCHPIAYIIVPYLAFLSPGALYPGIYACLAIKNLFSIMAYPILLILVKEASPAPCYLGKINGLAASVGAVCRTLASPIAGCLYGVGIQIGFTPLAWFASALVALLGGVQVFFIKRHKNKTSLVRGVVHFGDEVKSCQVSEVLHIIVQPADDAYSDEEEGCHEP